MSSHWIITNKPSFHTEWLMLPKPVDQQVLDKISLLAQDPQPDGLFKKQLPLLYGRLHCICAGTYRLFYTFERPHIRLLALRSCRESMDHAALSDLLLEGDPSLAEVPAQEMDWNALLTARAQPPRPLPQPITSALLEQFHIPRQYHAHLFSVRTQEALLDCRGVPYEIIHMVEGALWKKPLSEIVQQPDYVVEQLNDLERYKDGDLPSFLLLLSPEQERAARRALDAAGPTQVKGKPGTGKSTVALYRLRYLLERFTIAGQPRPRILFTTYTNALVASSRCLLERLLGADVDCVEVRTADSFLTSLFDEHLRIAEEGTLAKLIRDAIEHMLPEEATREQWLKRVSVDYLLEEILHVILVRQITSLEHYLDVKKVDRRGRRVRFSQTDRTLVWRIYEQLLSQLRDIRQETWQQVRLRAETILAARTDIPAYDAVVVDEAQDLDPSVLRILVKLCKAPNRFFITADANQTIYRAGFSWEDVDASLNFRGRTTILTTNYRSTYEIAEAAHSYLTMGAGDIDHEGAWTHLLHSSQPAIRMTQDEQEEYQKLAAFLSNATQTLHLGRGMCAVLCPTKRSGEAIARALKVQGIAASFLSRQQVDLSCPEVKVLTVHSSKGLEFPIVALSGFRGSRYATSYDDLSDDERAETLVKHRRLLFVGMTRAMRALLVLVPAETTSPLFTGFDAGYWDGGQRRKR